MLAQNPSGHLDTCRKTRRVGGASPTLRFLPKVIKAKRLTQAKAAKLLGVSQSRVSDLVRGKPDMFSLEVLITLATRAALHVAVKAAA